MDRSRYEDQIKDLVQDVDKLRNEITDLYAKQQRDQ